jgi:uncharacterized membrane protein YdjX (TVP38/TMEM64 family)
MGTLLGLTPGILAITFLGDRLGEAIRNPKLENFVTLAALALIFLGANVLIRRWLERRGKKPASLAENDEINS